MYKQNPKLLALIEPTVTAMGYELLGIEFLRQGRYSLLRLYIDKEQGITLDDCEAISREVTGLLDVEDPVAGAYHLEVSSPGLDRPLFTLEQFARQTGRNVRINLAGKVDGRRKLTGRIMEVTADTVVLDLEGSPIPVSADIIEFARIVPAEEDFDIARNKREH